MKPVRTIGIVNGGGDAPGLNAVIRAVVRTAISQHNMRVIGIRNGFDGLIWPEGAKEMNEDSVSGILTRGGTILGTTNRGNPFAYKTKENGVETVHDYSSLCMDNALPVIVFDMSVPGNIRRVIWGEAIGTYVGRREDAIGQQLYVEPQLPRIPVGVFLIEREEIEQQRREAG